ncbi:MAG: hypothetical protein DMG61_06475 [Acidobacteria bacterium]|nr:MAG: hypothetical protein DMG61_06475 [Acidobacteriota bacterium]
MDIRDTLNFLLHTFKYGIDCVPIASRPGKGAIGFNSGAVSANAILRMLTTKRVASLQTSGGKSLAVLRRVVQLNDTAGALLI